MKPETIEFIRKKLQASVEIAEKSMMYAIQSSGVDGVSSGVEEFVKKYQEAYWAMEDFEEWADEQEEDE